MTSTRVTQCAAGILICVWLAACGEAAPVASTSVAALPEASPSGSPDPLAACEDAAPAGEPVEITIETVSYAFDTELIEGPRHCQAFAITFTNHDEPNDLDPKGMHDIDIRGGNVLGPLLFDGALINGRGTSVRYEVPGLPAGEHYFYCSAHAGAMNGTLRVAP